MAVEFCHAWKIGSEAQNHSFFSNTFPGSQKSGRIWNQNLSWATLFRAKNFWKKPVFWRFRVPWVSKNYRSLFFYLYLWFFDILGTLKAKKTGFFQKKICPKWSGSTQILIPNPTTFLTSRASFRKKWMIFGLRSNFPCAAKFNGRLLFWKIFRGNGSKIAGSKLQLVLFDTFLYNKLILENSFLILPQHLPTCAPETPETHVSTYVLCQKSYF